jgi:uncharacterized protein (UPF0332 family)
MEELGLSPKSQSGTIALFGEKAVHERELTDPEYHSMLSRYQAKRQEADYQKEFLDSREDARKFVEDAEDMIEVVKDVLKQPGVSEELRSQD